MSDRIATGEGDAALRARSPHRRHAQQVLDRDRRAPRSRPRRHRGARRQRHDRGFLGAAAPLPRRHRRGELGGHATTPWSPRCCGISSPAACTSAWLGSLRGEISDLAALRTCGPRPWAGASIGSKPDPAAVAGDGPERQPLPPGGGRMCRVVDVTALHEPGSLGSAHGHQTAPPRRPSSTTSCTSGRLTLSPTRVSVSCRICWVVRGRQSKQRNRPVAGCGRHRGPHRRRGGGRGPLAYRGKLTADS